MDNYNIRQDRPRLSSEEIAQRKDFDGLLNDYYILKRPFYKNPWFFGVTGLATIGLLIGTTYSFTDSPEEPPSTISKTKVIPLEESKEMIHLASLELPSKPVEEPIHQKTKLKTLKKKEIYDKNSTLETTVEITNSNEPKKKESLTAAQNETKVEAAPSNGLQNHPRINGKIGGRLSLSEIKNGLTISTLSQIPVVGFEMHLATEFGAKVYRSNTGSLSPEMIQVLQNVSVDTEVYFEQIKGEIGENTTVGLQPLKYTIEY